ncbi:MULTISPECIES: FUSC family protein [Amycolatopsis]|uniref:FUSC family protein n=1 Tax=Amycolatopsis TaxID=1813 RepID=UPI001FEB06BE|nr:aromatic acid exporter family protein [Amycolatopsis sacchari]
MDRLRYSLRAPGSWLLRALRVPGREREALVQAGKMALAAVVAWQLARVLLPSPQSFIAPYAAVFLMAETVYRSLTNAAQQLVTLMLGLVLAYAGANLLPQPLLAMGVTVFLGMLVGQWHRLGSSGVWVGVIALLMIAGGTADSGAYLLERLGETVLGAGVGVAVNMLILPPVHLRHTRRTGSLLAGEIRELLSSIADDLGGDWDLDTARSWLRRARTLDQTVRRAEEAVSWGRESTRFNLRWRFQARRNRSPVPSRIESSIGLLGEVSAQVQRIAEALVTEEPLDSAFTQRFADLLHGLAQAIANYEESLDQGAESLRERLDPVHEKQRDLVQWVYEGRTLSAEARQTEDALLLAVSRALRVLANGGLAVGR